MDREKKVREGGRISTPSRGHPPVGERTLISRLIKKGCWIGLSLVIFPFLLEGALASSPVRKEASYYQRVGEGRVQCRLCPHYCLLSEGERGLCQVREAQGGRLYSLVYGLPCALHLGPVERAPLHHFLPGSQSLSLATAGCNLSCQFCQNWQMSQVGPEKTRNFELSACQVVKRAVENNCRIILFTYTEPVIFFEYMLSIAREARREGIKTVAVTAGYINPEPLRELTRYVDAFAVTLKAFNEEFYREIVGGELKPVMRTLEILREERVWFEIITQIIPTLSDDLDNLRKMFHWIRWNLGSNVPLHLTRFFPAYRLTHLPPTPIRTMEEARELALSVGLKYVYLGNVPGHQANNTFCPGCGEAIVERVGFIVLRNHIERGRCKFCRRSISGIWR